MFSLRLFLQNHSPIYTWHDLPPEVRGVFAPPNGILVRSECFIADPQRRYRFELSVLAPDGQQITHKADVVVIQDWGLLSLLRFGRAKSAAPRVLGLRPEDIVAAAYVPARRR
jgi:hypothetical protein